MRTLLLSLSLLLSVGGLAGTDEAPELTREVEPVRWRVSVGASFIGGLSSDVGVNRSRMSAASGFMQSIVIPGGFVGGRSRDDAKAAGLGTADPNGIRRFDDGAWYDPHDSASADDSDWSWNWRLHDPQSVDYDGRKGFVEYTEYSERTSSSSIDVSNGGGNCDDSSEWLPGFRIALERELYRSDDERPWGVDFGVGFSYYFQRGFWSVSGVAATAVAEASREDGWYEWWNDSGDTAKYILDFERDSQFSGGMWGAGGLAGPGAELQSSAWKSRDVPSSSRSWSSSHVLGYHGDGDYQEFAIDLIVRPWWEPYDWLRIFGSVGVEVARRSFDWSMSVIGTDGSAFHESGEESDWCVTGLLGGGISLRWNDLVLSGEGLCRCGGDGLGVNGLTVNGEIEHADYILRLMLGYEF